MTSTHEKSFPESAAHYKQIGWSFVAAIIVITITGFGLYVSGPKSSLRPTRVQPQLAADTAVVDTLLVTRPGSR